MIRKIEIQTSRNSKETQRNEKGPQNPGKVNQIKEIFRKGKGWEMNQVRLDRERKKSFEDSKRVCKKRRLTKTLIGLKFNWAKQEKPVELQGDQLNKDWGGCRT